MKFINLTPHKVNLIHPESNQKIASFESQGNARINTIGSYEMQNGIPLGTLQYGELEGLPEPKDNTMYILSTTAFNAAKSKGRNDVCFPTGKIFRDEEGNIIGTEFLSTKNS